MIDISVVIPVYNGEKHIGETLRSVLNQESILFEVIVVDDCSADNTLEIVSNVAKTDARVKCIQTPANSGGPALPRNLGINIAKGEWIAFCDADDVWHPKKLSLQISLARSQGANLVCAAIKDFPDGVVTQLPSSIIPSTVRFNLIFYWQMILKNRIATSSVICHRSLLSKMQFDLLPELVAVEDYDLWLRLMELPKFKVLRIATPLVAYRQTTGSLSSGKFQHALKVMLVSRLAFQRMGLSRIYPIAMPFIFFFYLVLSIYWRVYRKSL